MHVVDSTKYELTRIILNYKFSTGLQVFSRVYIQITLKTSFPIPILYVPRIMLIFEQKKTIYKKNY